jgi:membrane associated rhomboid family serine protease/Flp pilus assembly protein TadD
MSNDATRLDSASSLHQGKQMTNRHAADRFEPSPVGSATPTSASHWLHVSPTYALIGINVVVFALMLLSGDPLFKPTSEQILKWGGNYAPLSLDGQWWRLFTSIFVHIGLLHILVNMWCLYHLGSLAERFYSGWSVLLIYFLTGLAGSIASLSRSAVVVSAGSSGAIFGLAGLLIASLSVGKLSLPRRELGITVSSLIVFAAYNLVYGYLKGGIDNGAHLGGLICGLAIGIFLSRDLSCNTGALRGHVAVFPATIVVLLFAFGLVRQVRGQTVMIESAREALNKGDANLTIRQLIGLTRARRVDPAVYSILGAAYVQKEQYAQAEDCFRKVLEATPRDTAVRTSLALLYLRMGRLEDSRMEFAKAVELNPKADGDWLGLGSALQGLGRHEEAVTALAQALSLNPRLVQAQFELGISQMNLRQYNDAIAAFGKATELSPGDYMAQIWLANAYQAAGLTKEADAAYSKAYQLQVVSRRRRQPPGR